VAEEVLERWQHEHQARRGTACTAYVNGGSRGLADALADLERWAAGTPGADASGGAWGVYGPDSYVGAQAEATATLVAAPASHWPRRRVLLAVGLAVTLGAVTLTRAATASEASLLMTVISLAATMLAGAALATFVPSTGPLRRLEIGCGPCAAAGGLLAVASVWIAVSDPTQVGSATLAFGLGGIALVQRLSTPATCPAPASSLERTTTPVSVEGLVDSPLEAPPRSSAER